MTESFLRKYPYLRGEASYIDSNTDWKEKLKNFFRNTRKRGDRNVLEVASRIKLYAEKRKQKNQYTSQNMWGIKNFKPMSCEGEDEFSISAHKDILKAQVMLMPNARNAQIILKSMDKTFTSRRAFILDPPVKSIIDIKNEHPLLFTYQQILEEYQRLTEEELLTKFGAGVGKYSAKLVSLNPFKKEDSVLKELRQRMVATQLESRHKFFKQCCAVAVVPQQLREALDDMMYKDGESNSYPQIRIHKDMSDTIPADIIVEGEVVCLCGDLLTGFALMLAMYYVFNIAYPDELKSTLLFLQKGFTGIVDDTTKNVKVSKLFSTLLSQ